ncbi:hypothetical protein GQ457_14G018550 [Hibiscus cannabinus]
MVSRFALNLSLSLSLSLLLLLITNQEASAAKPGCKESCGNNRVPYPFGIGLNCSLNSWFEVSCNETSTPPTILLERTKMEVLNFSLNSRDYDSRLEFHRVKAPAVYVNCSATEASQGVNLKDSPFFFSEFRNRIVACTGGQVLSPNNISNTCNDGTCCETVMTSAIKTFNATFDGRSDGCNSAYLVEQSWRDSISNAANSAVGAVLDWAIPQEAFELSQSGNEYNCTQYGLIFDQPHRDTSIRCYCNPGYRGNAYLLNGCQDIDECKNETGNPCGTVKCMNKPGSYECERTKTWLIPLGMGVGFGSLCLVMGGWWLYKFLKKRREIKLKEKFFKRNGEKPVSFEREENRRSLTSYFIDSVEENRVLDMVDDRVMNQAKPEEIVMLAKLAYQCLSLSGKMRPTMKEVSTQLDQIVAMQKDSPKSQEEV